MVVFGLPFFKSKKANHPHYKNLHKKWAERHASVKTRVLSKHTEALHWAMTNLPMKEKLAVGSLSGLLMLTPPLTQIPPAPKPVVQQEFIDIPRKTFFLADVAKLVPESVRPLEPQEEEKIGHILSKHFNLQITAELDGKRLNRSYGLIGAEQHLMRYPGDTMATHFSSQEEANRFGRSGMAPGRGAWGYFVSSSFELTQKDIEREKYYIAVQTFLAPGFREHVREYYEFFRYRKMLVVNPHNGKAMVVVIGDAGPAAWTGKHLGGSPEVMSYLERVDGRARGPVLYFFIDDPNDTVPLGPIEPVQ